MALSYGPYIHFDIAYVMAIMSISSRDLDHWDANGTSLMTNHTFEAVSRLMPSEQRVAFAAPLKLQLGSPPIASTTTTSAAAMPRAFTVWSSVA